MEDLSKLPNLGKALVQKLIQADIKTSEELISLGSENAFIRLKTIDVNTCINTLYALEGAIQGIRWHDLDKNTRQELKEFFDQINQIQ